MTTATGRVFRSGNSEAIRVPKDVAFGREIEVTIVRSGDVLTIYPKRPRLHGLAAALAALPAPGEVEVRDADFFPDRPGL
jgi:antitoxin VapB